MHVGWHLHFSQAAFPERDKSRGVVINMSSMMARCPGPGLLGYRLGKAAQVCLINFMDKPMRSSSIQCTE